MSPVGKFELRSSKKFRYREKLDKIGKKGRMLEEAKGILSVSVLNHEKEEVDFSWSVTGVNSDTVSFNLEFPDPSSVSDN